MNADLGPRRVLGHLNLQHQLVHHISILEQFDIVASHAKRVILYPYLYARLQLSVCTNNMQRAVLTKNAK